MDNIQTLRKINQAELLGTRTRHTPRDHNNANWTNVSHIQFKYSLFHKLFSTIFSIWSEHYHNSITKSNKHNWLSRDFWPIRKVYGDLPVYIMGKSEHFSTVIGRRQQWCYIPLLWVSVITCKRDLFLTIIVFKNWLLLVS